MRPIRPRHRRCDRPSDRRSVRGALAAALLCGPAAVASGAGPAAAQPYEGTYEFVSEGWRGTLRAQQGGDGRLYFDVFNQDPPLSCGAFGAGTLQDGTLTWVDPVTGARLTLRFFEENAEIEAPAGLPEGCGSRAQIAGVLHPHRRRLGPGAQPSAPAAAALDKLGFEPGPIDGVMGPKTTQRACLLAQCPGPAGRRAGDPGDPVAGRETTCATPRWAPPRRQRSRRRRRSRPRPCPPPPDPREEALPIEFFAGGAARVPRLARTGSMLRRWRPR